MLLRSITNCQWWKKGTSHSVADYWSNNVQNETQVSSNVISSKISISNSRVFHVIFRHWEVVWKKGFARPTLRILDIGWNTAWNLIQKCIASLTNKTIWRNSTIKFTKSYRSCLWYPNQCQSSDFLGLLSWITFWESSSFVAFDLHLNLLDLISSCPSSLMYWDWEFMKLQPMKVWFIRINKDREFTRS